MTIFILCDGFLATISVPKGIVGINTHFLLLGAFVPASANLIVCVRVNISECVLFVSSQTCPSPLVVDPPAPPTPTASCPPTPTATSLPAIDVTAASVTSPCPSPLSVQPTSQQMADKVKLSRKIREYNRKTTPVHHIHIKSVVRKCFIT